MSDAPHPRPFRKKRIRTYAARSPAYCWMRAYRRDIAAALSRGEKTWADLVAEMARDGVKNSRGLDLSANAGLRVWQRVCRDADAAAATVASLQKKTPPSRMSRDWRPQIVPPGAPGSSAGAAGRGLAALSTVSGSRQVAVAQSASSPADFPTTDPKTGAPLAEGFVFFNGRTMSRGAAETLRKALDQVDEMDRFK